MHEVASIFGMASLGRALDATGRALDGGAEPRGLRRDARGGVPLPMQRIAISQPLWTGVRAIDALLTIGRGARVGVFGPPGAGKSTLLETIVAGTAADAVVVALVGERGREAQAWIERIDRRMTVVCSTSDRSAAERIACAQLAMTQARALADRGLHALVILDSLARVAYALRERGTAAGEAVGRGGYPPSVVPALAALVESAGAFRSGSVTLLATVLSDGGDDDPVSEAARSLLDGHIALTADLAGAGRFPAIDVPASASRTMHLVAQHAHVAQASRVRAALAALAATADARALGFEPADPAVRAAAAAEDRLAAFLYQGRAPDRPAVTLGMLAELADILGDPYEHRL